MLKACTICKALTEKRECEICKNKDLTEEWSGMVVVVNPKKSEIAKNIKIEMKGLFAQHCMSYE